MRSFNLKMVLNNVSQLKHIQLKNIYALLHAKNIPRLLYITTQWNFIILRKFSHMTLTPPNKK